jgi:hypothetical protein
MAKFVYGLILILVIGGTVALFFDHQAEKQVYSFCTSYSVGNYIKDIQQQAKKSEQELIIEDGKTMLFEIKTLSPFSTAITCEIEHAAGKVIELSFIKK